MNTEKIIANRITIAKKTQKLNILKLSVDYVSLRYISQYINYSFIYLFGEGLKKSIENNFVELFSNIRIENFTNNDHIYTESDTFSLNPKKIEQIKSLKN